jgi:predicted enzyme related to lactoylglutathione lyase
MQNPVVWFEIVGRNGESLQRFYRDLFGWTIEPANGDRSHVSSLPRPAGSQAPSDKARTVGTGTSPSTSRLPTRLRSSRRRSVSAGRW